MIFIMAPLVAEKLNKLSYPEHPCIIIVCPLNYLIDSHIRELSKRGLCASARASALSDISMDAEKYVLKGECTYVFCNPESILNNQKWREMLSSDIYQTNIIGFVTDEVHVVPKW